MSSAARRALTLFVGIVLFADEQRKTERAADDMEGPPHHHSHRANVFGNLVRSKRL